MNKIIKKIFPVLFIYSHIHAQPAIPCGHSHNDYLQKRPLFSAVELGFGSIEIDVCLDKNNQIKVAHNPIMLASKKNIEEMYLDPIASMIQSNDPRFTYTTEYPLTLVIDIKTNGDSTYKYLKHVLEKYPSMITRYQYGKGVVYPAPVRIILSGSRPVAPILMEETNLVKIDMGKQYFSLFRPDTIDPRRIDFIIGQINNAYYSTLTYRGNGKPTQSDINKLHDITNRAHKIHSSVRFYAAGNNKRIWTYLLNGDVDYINVDNLNKFSRFYKEYKK